MPTFATPISPERAQLAILQQGELPQARAITPPSGDHATLGRSRHHRVIANHAHFRDANQPRTRTAGDLAAGRAAALPGGRATLGRYGRHPSMRPRPAEGTTQG